MVGSRSGQSWAGRVVTQIDAYYGEICNSLSKTPEKRNPVHHLPQAIGQKIASISWEGRDPGPWQMRTGGVPVTWQQGCCGGHRVPAGLCRGGCSYGWLRVGPQGSWEVECDGCWTYLKCCSGSLFRGVIVLLLWGEELLRNSAFMKPSGEPARTSCSSAQRLQWQCRPGRGDCCRVENTAARLLGIPLSITGETPSHIWSKKIIYTFDLGHNTQKLFRGGKWHPNLPWGP